MKPKIASTNERASATCAGDQRGSAKYGVAVVSSGCRTVPLACNTPASRSATPARRSKARVGIRLAERQGRPDAVGDEGLGQRAGDLVGGRPAGAVAGDEVA